MNKSRVILLFLVISTTQLFAQNELTDTIHLNWLGKMSPKKDYVIYQNKTYSLLTNLGSILAISKGNHKLSKAFDEALKKSEQNIYSFILQKYPELEIDLLWYNVEKIQSRKCMLYNRETKKYENDIYAKPHHDVGTSGTLYFAKTQELFYSREIIY